MNSFFDRSHLVIRRRAAARVLFHREQEFRALVENTPDLIARFDRDLRRRYVNPAIERVTGKPSSELIGTTLQERNFDGRFVGPLEEALRQTFETGTERTVDVRLPGPDGERRYQARIVPEFDVKGAIETALVISRDITSLHRSEERLRGLIGTAHDAILTLDRKGGILEANPSFLRMMGEPAANLVGRPLLDFVPPEHADDAIACFRATAGRGEISHIATALRTSSGELVFIEATTSRQGGEIFWIARDVTERRRVQEELESARRMAALGRVSMLMSHQFNNVLMGIQPFAELVLRSTSEPRTRDFTSRIIASVARGRRITEDLRAFTHPEPLQMVAIDAASLLRHALPSLRELLPPEIQLVETLEEHPGLVDADARQLIKAIENLVLNARDAIGTNKGTICLDLHESAGGVRITLADDGEGMDPETLDVAAEPFLTTRPGRAGLGLTTARQIVEAHGGTFGIRSARGEGTTIELLFPLSSSTGRQTAADAQAGGWPASILLVEDDALVAAGVAGLLEEERRKVVVAGDGREALEVLRTFQPDALVIDVNLPDCNGFELFERIVEARGPLPVLFASGHADATRLASLHAPLGSALLMKPYDIATLLAMLASLRPEA